MNRRAQKDAAESPGSKHSLRPDGSVTASAGRLLEAATGLSAKLGLASTVVVSLVVGAGALFYYHGEKQRLDLAANDATAAYARLVATGLEPAMLANDQALIASQIEKYAGDLALARIYIVDGHGTVAFATESSWIGRRAPLPSQQAAVVEETHTSRLRSVTPLANSPECAQCHSSDQDVLGLLGIDIDLAPLHQARAALISRTAQWGAAITLLVLIAVGAVVQLGALRPLRRLRDSTRALSGNTKSPASKTARDEIGQLAEHIRAFSFTLQQSREEVGHQRQFLIGLIDRMDDGVAVFDRNLRIVAANKSYLGRIARRSAQGLTEGLECSAVHLCSCDNNDNGCPTRRAFCTSKVEKDLHRRSLEGREVYYEVFASPMIGDSGSVEHVVEVWRDVSERTTIEAHLAQSERLAAVGVLASGFSHEISTPLGTVATTIQGILRRLRPREGLDHSDIERLCERLDIACKEVFRCRDITRSLLDLSRRKRTTAGQVTVEAVVTRMLDVVRPTAEHNNVRIESAIAAELPQILGHTEQLEMVMLNLYINAIEAMPDGGVLSVGVTDDNGMIDVDVCDTGVGVAPQDRVRVFEPFFSRKARGTGLGLYLSRQVVEDHGGRIEVSSLRKQGTRIHFTLPHSRGASQQAPHAGESA